MIDDILFKLDWSKDGIWSARLTPEECAELLAYIQRIKTAVVRVKGKDVQVVIQP